MVGFDSQIIEVEADTNNSQYSFSIVGLGDKVVDESKERINSAIKNSKLKAPYAWGRTIINLAPADLKKQGSLYDFPIALAYLLQTKQTVFDPKEKLFFGELSLSGQLRSIQGSLSFSLMAVKKGFKEIILPKENATEAALALLSLNHNSNNLNKNFKIIGIENLQEAIFYLEGKIDIKPTIISLEKIKKIEKKEKEKIISNFNNIKGQELAKRAVEISAAGSHNLFMFGPPGTGKTLLAKALGTLLPDLTFEESLELTKIYSVAGFLKHKEKEIPLIVLRPFRSPHHSASKSALIGGGNPLRVGEITLAHRGILFLDEWPEFHIDVLESLRQPLEDGTILILRANQTLEAPARFTLIAAANPCPCGFLNDLDKECICQSSQIAKYKRKLSGPLMDRMDIFIEVARMKYEKLISINTRESNDFKEKDENQFLKTKNRINNARKIQEDRFKKDKLSKNKIGFTNSQIDISQIEKYCKIDKKSEIILRKYVDSGKVSVRVYHKILKVARTIADLEKSENIQFNHLSEALMYRNKIRV